MFTIPIISPRIIISRTRPWIWKQCTATLSTTTPPPKQQQPRRSFFLDGGPHSDHSKIPANLFVYGEDPPESDGEIETKLKALEEKLTMPGLQYLDKLVLLSLIGEWSVLKGDMTKAMKSFDAAIHSYQEFALETNNPKIYMAVAARSPKEDVEGLRKFINDMFITPYLARGRLDYLMGNRMKFKEKCAHEAKEFRNQGIDGLPDIILSLPSIIEQGSSRFIAVASLLGCLPNVKLEHADDTRRAHVESIVVKKLDPTGWCKLAFQVADESNSRELHNEVFKLRDKMFGREKTFNLPWISSALRVAGLSRDGHLAEQARQATFELKRYVTTSNEAGEEIDIGIVLNDKGDLTKVLDDIIDEAHEVCFKITESDPVARFTDCVSALQSPYPPSQKLQKRLKYQPALEKARKGLITEGTAMIARAEKDTMRALKENTGNWQTKSDALKNQFEEVLSMWKYASQCASEPTTLLHQDVRLRIARLCVACGDLNMALQLGLEMELIHRIGQEAFHDQSADSLRRGLWIRSFLLDLSSVAVSDLEDSIMQRVVNMLDEIDHEDDAQRFLAMLTRARVPLSPVKQIFSARAIDLNNMEAVLHRVMLLDILQSGDVASRVLREANDVLWNGMINGTVSYRTVDEMLNVMTKRDLDADVVRHRRAEIVLTWNPTSSNVEKGVACITLRKLTHAAEFFKQALTDASTSRQARPLLVKVLLDLSLPQEAFHVTIQGNDDDDLITKILTDSSFVNLPVKDVLDCLSPVMNDVSHHHSETIRDLCTQHLIMRLQGMNKQSAFELVNETSPSQTLLHVIRHDRFRRWPKQSKLSFLICAIQQMDTIGKDILEEIQTRGMLAEMGDAIMTPHGQQTNLPLLRNYLTLVRDTKQEVNAHVYLAKTYAARHDSQSKALAMHHFWEAICGQNRWGMPRDVSVMNDALQLAASFDEPTAITTALTWGIPTQDLPTIFGTKGTLLYRMKVHRSGKMELVFDRVGVWSACPGDDVDGAQYWLAEGFDARDGLRHAKKLHCELPFKDQGVEFGSKLIVE